MEQQGPDVWELFGCGHRPEYAGQSKVERTRGATEPPYNRTCENYYWELDAVHAVLADLEDYRRGALGNVLDLPFPHLAALRVADHEMAEWSAHYEAQIMSEASSG